MSLHLTAGQIENIGAVHMQKASGVDIHLTLMETVDDDHIVSLDGTLSLRAEPLEELCHSDKHIVRIGAEVIGIVSGLVINQIA